MESRNFGLFRGLFDRLYLQHFKALLGCRLYAIFREGEKLVVRPAKYARIGGYATALESDDFSFLKNLPEDYKRRLMVKYETSPYGLSDLSYDEYIKTYRASMEEGKHIFKDWTWGIYVNPLYANLEDIRHHYGKKAASPKFDYISLAEDELQEGHYFNEDDDLMFAMVDSAMGVVIGGNDFLVSESKYWREGEKWVR